MSFRTTRARLAVISVGMFGAAVVFADIVIFLAFGFVQNNEADSQLRTQAVTVAAGLRSVDGHVTYKGSDLPHETQAGTVIDMAVVGPQGVLGQTPDNPLAPNTLVTLADVVFRSGRPASWVDIQDSQGVARRVYAIPVTAGDQPAVLMASAPRTEVESSVLRAMVPVAVLSLAALGGTGFLVYWLVGRVLKPVSQIATLAETLSEKDLHRRVETTVPNDELGQLVATFNRMLERLEGGFNTLRRFTADASHELRAPLALMGTELELSLSRRRSPEELGRVLRLLQSEVQQMTSLVDKLLLLARLDADELRADPETIDVADFLHESAARWFATAERAGIDLQVAAPESGSLVADPGLTKRILDNLIDNAVHHSPRGGSVRISAAQEGLGWAFEVADQGPGVASDQKDRIFGRFAQADPARARDGTSGAGLGLSLSAAFAKVQGGNVRLVESARWGAVFRLWLPDRQSGSLVSRDIPRESERLSRARHGA